MVTPDDHGRFPPIDFSDAKLQAFYNAAVAAVTEKIMNVRFPSDYGVPDRCWCNDRCKWSTLSRLVDRFWNHGPDVDEDWKSEARRRGFDPEELHETMLTVFLGIPDPPAALWRDVAAAWKIADVYIPAKHINL